MPNISGNSRARRGRQRGRDPRRPSPADGEDPSRPGRLQLAGHPHQSGPRSFAGGMRRENEAALASLRRAMAQPAEADLPGNGAAGFLDFGNFLV